MTIRGIPDSVYTSLVSFMEITGNYFAFYSRYGLYMDMDDPTFEDNGDNTVTGNYFYSRGASAVGIKYRCGGLRATMNKINGGLIGIDVSPLRSSSVILINGNSIENQTNTCIRYFTEGDTQAAAFGRFTVNSNQLNAVSAAGSAISFNSTAFTCREIVISANQIAHNSAANAIDIRNCNRFNISGNEVYGNGATLYGVFVDATSSEGAVSGNFINGTSLGKVLINSNSVLDDRISGLVEETYTYPALVAGSSVEIGIAVAGAAFGDIAEIVWLQDTNGLNLSAWVYAADAVKVKLENTTATTFSGGDVAHKIVTRRT